MKRALPWWLPLGLLVAGCAEEELARVPTHVGSGVVVTDREPGSCCRALAAVEVQSDRDDAPTGDTLRDYALARGANYVVLDDFGVFDDDLVRTRARLFACPELPVFDQ